MFSFKKLFCFLAVLFGIMTILSGSFALVIAADKPEIFVQLGHTSSVNAIEISPDNKYILSGGDDNRIKLWENETGRLIRTFNDKEDIKFVSFLPGGKSFFSLNDRGNICIWDISTGDKIKEYSLSNISYSSLRSVVSYDGTTLRVIVGLKIFVTDILSGTIEKSIESPKSKPVSAHLSFAFGSRNAMTADGLRMISSVRQNPSENVMSAKDKKLIFWDITSGNIISTLSGHEDYIDTVILSPDDRFALSGSRDNTVRLWDLKKGKEVAKFSGHQKPIEAIAFSPDQKYILSGSDDNTMKLWDIEDEKEIRSFTHDCPVTFVRFSPDGLFAYSGDDNGAIRVWDIKTGREVKALKSHAARTYAIALSADGNQVLTGSSEGQIGLWNLTSGKLLKTISAHHEAVSAINFTPDGKYALSASYDKTLKLWDLNDGKLQKTFSGHPGQVYKAVISADGLHALSSAQDGDMRLWDMKSGIEIKAFKFPGSIQSIGFTPDSRHFIIAHYCKNSGDAVKVMALDGNEIKNYEDVYLSRYTNDGRYFLATRYKEPTDKEQKLFDPETKQKTTNSRMDRFNIKTLVDISDGKILGHFGQSGAFVYVSTSSRNELILTKNYYDKDICLWDVRTGKEIHRFPVKFGLLSHDGNKVISPVGNTLKSFDTITGRILPPFTGSAATDICSLALSAKGGYAITGDTSGAIQFWDVAAGKLIKTIFETPTKDIFYDKSAISAVTFSPDNKYAASASIFGTVKIWDLSEGNKISEFKMDPVSVHYDDFQSGNYIDYGNGILAFSPDSRYIASGSKLWEVTSGKKRLDFQTPFGPGPWVAFTQDGNYLLSRNMIWDVYSGRRIKTLESLNGTRSVYSSDGKAIYATDSEGSLYVVDPDTGKLVRRFANFISTARPFEVSPDKKMLIATENDNETLDIWDLTSGKKNAAIEINQGISSVLLSSDGRKAVLNNSVSVMQLNPSTGKEMAKFISFTDGEWIVITPEGYYNASANGDKYLNVRVGNNVYGIENYREVFFRPDLVKIALSGGSLKDFRNIADIKQPPSVNIVDTPLSVNTDNVKLKLRLTDNAGGIGDIRLYLNGTAVVMDSRAVSIIEKDTKELFKEYTLKLTAGRNIIKAVAFNGDNSMQSNEATIEVAASFTAAQKPSLYALVIGINEFKNPKLKLNYPVADAELFAETLEKVSTGLFDKIDIRKLTTKEATTNLEIIKEIKSFKSLQPDDLFVFYIASHGTVDEGEYFLITSNVGSLRTEKLKTDAISQNMLKETIANIPATKKLIIIDTCNAGALGEAIQVAMLTRGMSEDTALKILSRAVGSTILSASTSVQEALEGYNGHGLFTYVIVEGLKGKADKGKTGFIKTTELADYVDNEVPVLAEKVFKRAQYPTISISGQAFPIGLVK
ncbi:MAG: caspase family protein [Pseudomonadota bacterium]